MKLADIKSERCIAEYCYGSDHRNDYHCTFTVPNFLFEGLHQVVSRRPAALKTLVSIATMSIPFVNHGFPGHLQHQSIILYVAFKRDCWICIVR